MTRPWSANSGRLTAKWEIFFQKAYLSSLQGNKHGQICAPFALLKDKMLSASGGASQSIRQILAVADRRCRLTLSAHYEPPHFYDKVYDYSTGRAHTFTKANPIWTQESGSGLWLSTFNEDLLVQRYIDDKIFSSLDQFFSRAVSQIVENCPVS